MKKRKIIALGLAAILGITAFSGCGNQESSNGKTVEVSWYLPGVKMDSSWDNVWNKVNELMEERYGLRVKIEMIDGANFSQKMQMMNASREPYDLTFTSNWANDYTTNVANGSLLDLTELIPEVAPKLWEDITEDEKQAITVDGRIYGIPHWQVQAIATGFSFPTELLEKTGMTLDDFNEIKDLEPYFDKVAEIDPLHNSQNYLGWNSIAILHGFEGINGTYATINLKKDGKPEVFNAYATPEFAEYCRLVRAWVEKGYLPSTSDNRNYDGTGLIRAAVQVDNWKPGVIPEMERRLKMDLIGKQVGDATKTTSLFVSTMAGIGVNSKHPEEALKVLEIMRTDREIYNMLSFGIEGVDYEKIGENTIRVSETSTYTIPNWSIGSVANSYIMEGNPETLWEDTKKFNDEAIASPLLGFEADVDDLMATIGNCESVVKEYSDSLNRGRFKDVDGTIAELNRKLEEAGINEILTEIQIQIDEWWEE